MAKLFSVRVLSALSSQLFYANRNVNIFMLLGRVRLLGQDNLQRVGSICTVLAGDQQQHSLACSFSHGRLQDKGPPRVFTVVPSGAGSTPSSPAGASTVVGMSVLVESTAAGSVKCSVSPHATSLLERISDDGRNMMRLTGGRWCAGFVGCIGHVEDLPDRGK